MYDRTVLYGEKGLMGLQCGQQTKINWTKVIHHKC